MKTISDADWEIIKSAAQVAIDGTLSRSKHKEWSDAMSRVQTQKPMDVHAPGSWHNGLVSLFGAATAPQLSGNLDTHDYELTGEFEISAWMSTNK